MLQQNARKEQVSKYNQAFYYSHNAKKYGYYTTTNFANNKKKGCNRCCGYKGFGGGAPQKTRKTPQKHCKYPNIDLYPLIYLVPLCLIDAK
jgi:hypothetical protein